MKRPHLLRVEAPAGEFAELIAAAAAEGLRVGWLELGSAPTPPTGLEAAASLGVLRAVAAGDGRTVAVKPLRGRPVLDDLLREHFRGCRLVLVRGAVDAPTLAPAEEGWTIGEAGGGQILGTARLVRRLRSPLPLGRGEGPPDASR